MKYMLLVYTNEKSWAEWERDQFTAASTPAITSSGATGQSDPNASTAPASSSERKAYDDAHRSLPIRPSAYRPSSIAWYGCIDATTPRNLM